MRRILLVLALLAGCEGDHEERIKEPSKPQDLPPVRAAVQLSYVAEDDEFTSEERARLIEAIEQSEGDIANGDYVDGMEFANQLLAKREAASR